MTKHFNKSSETPKRKWLRNNAPNVERKLWQHLKSKQLADVKFRRQYSVDAFVIDFYAPSCKLGIEIDGDTHFTQDALEYDRKRSRYIAQFGIEIIRFTNADVYKNIEGVLGRIEEVAQRRSSEL